MFGRDPITRDSVTALVPYRSAPRLVSRQSRPTIARHYGWLLSIVPYYRSCVIFVGVEFVNYRGIALILLRRNIGKGFCNQKLSGRNNFFMNIIVRSSTCLISSFFYGGDFHHFFIFFRNRHLNFGCSFGAFGGGIALRPRVFWTLGPIQLQLF